VGFDRMRLVTVAARRHNRECTFQTRMRFAPGFSLLGESADLVWRLLSRAVPQFRNAKTKLISSKYKTGRC
jgi:hypothetical protein